jgi:hypothetical protein
MVPYMSFYEFKKIKKNCSKSIGAYGLPKNPSLRQNGPKLCISVPRPSYSGSFLPNHPVYEFLHVLKKSNFHSKSIGASLRFSQKFLVCDKNGPKLCISML